MIEPVPLTRFKEPLNYSFPLGVVGIITWSFHILKTFLSKKKRLILNEAPFCYICRNFVLNKTFWQKGFQIFSLQRVSEWFSKPWVAFGKSLPDVNVICTLQSSLTPRLRVPHSLVALRRRVCLQFSKMYFLSFVPAKNFLLKGAPFEMGEFFPLIFAMLGASLGFTGIG